MLIMLILWSTQHPQRYGRQTKRRDALRLLSYVLCYSIFFIPVTWQTDEWSDVHYGAKHPIYVSIISSSKPISIHMIFMIISMIVLCKTHLFRYNIHQPLTFHFLPYIMEDWINILMAFSEESGSFCFFNVLK